MAIYCLGCGTGNDSSASICKNCGGHLASPSFTWKQDTNSKKGDINDKITNVKKNTINMKKVIDNFDDNEIPEGQDIHYYASEDNESEFESEVRAAFANYFEEVVQEGLKDPNHKTIKISDLIPNNPPANQ